MKRIISIILIICLSFSLMLTANCEEITTESEIMKQDIDELLKKPYTDTVPVGFSENLFALHSSGWGFDSNSIFRTGISTGYGMPVNISLNGAKITATDATYRPSSVESTVTVSYQEELYENVALNATAEATFSYEKYGDKVGYINDGVISYGASPRNRWSNYSSSNSTDSVTLTLPSLSKLDKIAVHFFTDTDATALPSKVELFYYDGGAWKAIDYTSQPSSLAQKAANVYLFDEIVTSKIKITVTRASGKYVGITELEAYGVSLDVKNIATSSTATASYVYSKYGDILEAINNGIISYNESPRDRWGNYLSPNASDWIAFEFDAVYTANKAVIYLYDDGSGTRVPADIKIQYLDGSEWKTVENMTAPSEYVANGANEFTFADVKTQNIRFMFTRQSGKYCGASEIEIFAYDNNSASAKTGYTVTERKYISTKDVACSEIVIENIEGLIKRLLCLQRLSQHRITGCISSQKVRTLQKRALL